MGTESPCVPNCPKGLCICQKQHGNQNSGCARWPHSPAVSLAFLLPQLTIPKLPVCHAGVTQSISPSPNLGIWSHLQLSCSSTEPLDGELKNPCNLSQIWGSERHYMEKSRRNKGTEQDCALSTTALTTLQFLGELAHHDQEEGTQRHVWGLVLHLLPGFVLRFDPSDSSSLQISPPLTPCPLSGLQQEKIHSGCKSQLTSSRAHRALHKQYLIQKGPQILLFCEILGIT